jgi:hypothetical protein
MRNKNALRRAAIVFSYERATTESVLTFFAAESRVMSFLGTKGDFQNARPDSSCRSGACGSWLGCLAELGHPIRNGIIFGLSAYNDGFYLGYSQSSPFRIPARPTNRPSVSGIH